MKTERGYIVAMHNLTNKIVTISLEMWDLIENTDIISVPVKMAE